MADEPRAKKQKVECAYDERATLAFYRTWRDPYVRENIFSHNRKWTKYFGKDVDADLAITAITTDCLSYLKYDRTPKFYLGIEHALAFILGRRDIFDWLLHNIPFGKDCERNIVFRTIKFKKRVSDDSAEPASGLSRLFDLKSTERAFVLTQPFTAFAHYPLQKVHRGNWDCAWDRLCKTVFTKHSYLNNHVFDSVCSAITNLLSLYYQPQRLFSYAERKTYNCTIPSWRNLDDFIVVFADALALHEEHTYAVCFCTEFVDMKSCSCTDCKYKRFLNYLLRDVRRYTTPLDVQSKVYVCSHGLVETSPVFYDSTTTDTYNWKSAFNIIKSAHVCVAVFNPVLIDDINKELFKSFVGVVAEQYNKPVKFVFHTRSELHAPLSATMRDLGAHFALMLKPQ